VGAEAEVLCHSPGINGHFVSREKKQFKILRNFMTMGVSQVDSRFAASEFVRLTTKFSDTLQLSELRNTGKWREAQIAPSFLLLRFALDGRPVNGLRRTCGSVPNGMAVWKRRLR
jgi:hypothetical protein